MVRNRQSFAVQEHRDVLCPPSSDGFPTGRHNSLAHNRKHIRTASDRKSPASGAPTLDCHSAVSRPFLTWSHVSSPKLVPPGGGPWFSGLHIAHREERVHILCHHRWRTGDSQPGRTPVRRAVPARGSITWPGMITLPPHGCRQPRVRCPGGPQPGAGDLTVLIQAGVRSETGLTATGGRRPFRGLVTMRTPNRLSALRFGKGQLSNPVSVQSRRKFQLGV